MMSVLRQWIERYFPDEEAVILAVFLVLGTALVMWMGKTLAPVLASVVLAFLMQGVIVRLTQRGMPFNAAMAVAFLLFIGGFFSTLLFLLPMTWHQLTKLVTEFPNMLAKGQQILNLLPQRYPNLITEAQIQSGVEYATTEFAHWGQRLLSVSLASVSVMLTAIVYLVMVPILVFFLLKDRVAILNWMRSLLPKQHPAISRIWYEVNEQFANYVRGKVMQIVIVGLITYVAFVWLGLNYAELLALAFGVSVVVPYVGAAVVTVPIALIGYFQWGFSYDFIYLMVVFMVIQALDGNVIVPLLFSEAVNLHPIVIIVAVLFFGDVWGFWGVFFAIPLATLCKAVLYAWPRMSEQVEGVRDVV